MPLDPRLNAYRPDLADVRLRGHVESARFVEGEPRRVVAVSAPMKRTPRADAPLDSEVLRGEVFTVFEDGGEGWSWGQLQTDGYVAHVPTDALGPMQPEPTHRIVALRTFVYPGPDMKLPARAAFSFGSLVSLDREESTRGTAYRRLAGGEGWIVLSAAAEPDAPPENDFVAVAERFLNVAYLWGGRTSLGLDCSALVQLSLMATGIASPRDTDMQEAVLGVSVAHGSGEAHRRGDLVFWPGHVAIMIDGEHMIHASGHHMAVVIEPVKAAVERIARSHQLPSSIRRIA